MENWHIGFHLANFIAGIQQQTHRDTARVQQVLRQAAISQDPSLGCLFRSMQRYTYQ